MANMFLAAVLLSSTLAVSGCIGGLPNLGALGAALGGLPSSGGYPSSGGGQPYPYDPGAGGGYAQQGQPYYQQGQPYYQQSQPYYQPQPYAYSGNPGVYSQPVPQATQGYTGAPSGRWIDRREQRQQYRIQQGVASGQLTPQEAARLQNQQGRIRGAEGRMRADGNLGPQERTRLNGMQNRSSQDIYRLRHNGVQPGPTATPGHGAPATYGAIAPGGATGTGGPIPGRSITQQRPPRNDGGTP